MCTAMSLFSDESKSGYASWYPRPIRRSKPTYNTHSVTKWFPLGRHLEHTEFLWPPTTEQSFGEQFNVLSNELFHLWHCFVSPGRVRVFREVSDLNDSRALPFLASITRWIFSSASWLLLRYWWVSFISPHRLERVTMRWPRWNNSFVRSKKIDRSSYWLPFSVPRTWSWVSWANYWFSSLALFYRFKVCFPWTSNISASDPVPFF